MNLRELFKATLEGDSELTSLLTGGIIDKNSAEAGRTGVSLETAPKQAGGVLIDPFMVIHWRTTTDYAPAILPSEAIYPELWIYQDTGTGIIDAARERAKKLLNLTYINGATDSKLAFIRWAGGDILEFMADELGGASGTMCRFQILRLRK